VALTLHALLGTLLLITGISAVVRAAFLRGGVLITITGVALLAILLAWLSGLDLSATPVMGSQPSCSGTGVAIICYATILFGATEPVEYLNPGAMIQHATEGPRDRAGSW